MLQNSDASGGHYALQWLRWCADISSPWLLPIESSLLLNVLLLTGVHQAPLLPCSQYLVQELLGSRYSQFLEIDKPALKPLPISRYQYGYWKKARAGIDYHVTIEKHHYSVPYHYLKETITIAFSISLIWFRCIFLAAFSNVRVITVFISFRVCNP